jgi:hypothetical protein
MSTHVTDPDTGGERPSVHSPGGQTCGHATASLQTSSAS